MDQAAAAGASAAARCQCGGVDRPLGGASEHDARHRVSWEDVVAAQPGRAGWADAVSRLLDEPHCDWRLFAVRQWSVNTDRRFLAGEDRRAILELCASAVPLDPCPRVRFWGSVGLAVWGKPDAALRGQILRSQDPSARLALLTGHVVSTAEFETLLSDDEPWIRASAVLDAAGHRRGDLVLRALGDPDESVRIAAAAGAAEFGLDISSWSVQLPPAPDDPRALIAEFRQLWADRFGTTTGLPDLDPLLPRKCPSEPPLSEWRHRFSAAREHVAALGITYDGGSHFEVFDEVMRLLSEAHGCGAIPELLGEWHRLWDRLPIVVDHWSTNLHRIQSGSELAQLADPPPPHLPTRDWPAWWEHTDAGLVFPSPDRLWAARLRGLGDAARALAPADRVAGDATQAWLLRISAFATGDRLDPMRPRTRRSERKRLRP